MLLDQSVTFMTLFGRGLSLLIPHCVFRNVQSTASIMTIAVAITIIVFSLATFRLNKFPSFKKILVCFLKVGLTFKTCFTEVKHFGTVAIIFQDFWIFFQTFIACHHSCPLLPVSYMLLRFPSLSEKIYSAHSF